MTVMLGMVRIRGTYTIAAGLLPLRVWQQVFIFYVTQLAKMSTPSGDEDDGASGERAEWKVADDGAQGWQIAVQVIHETCRCDQLVA
jgi:hypothetical protein